MTGPSTKPDGPESELAALRVELQAARDRAEIAAWAERCYAAEAALQSAREALRARTDESVKQRREIATLTAKLSEARRCYDLRRERSDNAEAALQDAREALREAADWLDADLAHAPDTAVSMADRALVASWRAVLVEGAPSDDDLKAAGAMDGGFYSDDLGDACALGGEGS